MSHGQRVMVVAVGVVVLTGLVLRAVTVHSVGNPPLIYRVTTNNNDLDSVEGVAAPGRLVELWYRQRNFREGIESAGPGQDPFSWCSWKNRGTPVQIGSAWTDSRGVWHVANLRQSTTVMVFPSAAGDRTCQGGVYTELLPRACDSPGVNCSAWSPPSMHWLNVKRQNPLTATAAGSVSGAEQASIAVADGPDDGPEPSSVFDVDSNGIDTTQPGFLPGQRVTWKCSAGGTAVCPSITPLGPISTPCRFAWLWRSRRGHNGWETRTAGEVVVRRDDPMNPTLRGLRGPRKEKTRMLLDAVLVCLVVEWLVEALT